VPLWDVHFSCREVQCCKNSLNLNKVRMASCHPPLKKWAPWSSLEEVFFYNANSAVLSGLEFHSAPNDRWDRTKLGASSKPDISQAGLCLGLPSPRGDQYMRDTTGWCRRRRGACAVSQGTARCILLRFLSLSTGYNRFVYLLLDTSKLGTYKASWKGVPSFPGKVGTCRKPARIAIPQQTLRRIRRLLGEPSSRIRKLRSTSGFPMPRPLS